MSIISGPRSRGLALALSAWLGAVTLGGCALFGASGPTPVAQGKYYSSGDPRYDAYFIQLYDLQVELEAAPQVPTTERQNLARALGLSPQTPTSSIVEQLHESALKLSREGVRMRLEQSVPARNAADASATLRTTHRPKDTPLLGRIEASATELLRTSSAMKVAANSLAQLDVDTINLDAEVPSAFARARVGKQSEVKQNLADAQKLLVLMKARAQAVRSECDELLASIAQAVNTDDGSLDSPAETVPEPKHRFKARSRVHPAGPSSQARPPNTPRVHEDTHGSAPAKPAPAARDFEP